MKRFIAFILLFSLALALVACAAPEQADPSEPPAVTDAAEKTPTAPYEGKVPADLFGVFDEETYTNTAFGVKYLRDGSWSFYTIQELNALNGSTGEAVSERLKSTGFAYDMYARSGAETLGFGLAIPSVQFGAAMDEAAYAQAVKAASARDYAGADYDVVSDEIATAQFGEKEHACYYMTVAANGMVFYTARIFLQQGDFIGVIYVSAESEAQRTSLLNAFRYT